MSRWTNVDRLLLELSDLIDSELDERGLYSERWRGIMDSKGVIVNAPSIDLVYCKECRYEDMELCPMYKLVRAGVRKPDDFCSYGERKEKRKVTQSETWTKECQRCHKQFTSASRNTQYCPECRRANRKAQSGSKRPETYSPNFNIDQYELAIRRKAIERAKHNDDIVAEGYAERQIRSSLAQVEPINTKL